MTNRWLLAKPVIGLIAYLVLRKKAEGNGEPPPGNGQPPPGNGEPPPEQPKLVTVTLKASDYDHRAKYWSAMTSSIHHPVPVPITEPIVYTVPSDDVRPPNGFTIVDMYDGEPLYGGGKPLRNDPMYPNQGFGLTGSRDLIDGEILTWITYPNGWWRDIWGNWL